MAAIGRSGILVVILVFSTFFLQNGHHDSMLEGATIEKNGYFTRSFWMLEHYGTHMDAPAHFPPGKTTVDQIPVKQLFGAAVVIDVRAESIKDADYQLPAARIEDFEKKYGRIPEGAIVLLRTGWASRWPDVQKYRNQDAKGQMH